MTKIQFRHGTIRKSDFSGDPDHANARLSECGRILLVFLRRLPSRNRSTRSFLPMSLWTCEQCGAQFPESPVPPRSCPICEDERQYVNWKGQTWLTPEQLTQRCRLTWRDDLGVPGIGVEPSFAIGQRALLLREADGCVMWDCVPLATPEAIDYVRSLGGLKAIAISHPHYYGAVADWSEAFGGVRVYLHGDDRAWVTRPHRSIVPWTGESCRLSEDILILRAGGHFAGGTVLHWTGAR
jgi:hypothetical protein